jgi:hypothetical protein
LRVLVDFTGDTETADFYGRHLIRILQHPTQYWGWLLLFAAMILGLITGGILINRRLASVSAG